jgi:hypothetical protein
MFSKCQLHPEIGGLAGAMSDLKEPQTISLIDEDRKRAKPFKRLRCGIGNQRDGRVLVEYGSIASSFPGKNIYR